MPNMDFSRNTRMESSGIFQDDNNPRVTNGHWILLMVILAGALIATGALLL